MVHAGAFRPCSDVPRSAAAWSTSRMSCPATTAQLSEPSKRMNQRPPTRSQYRLFLHWRTSRCSIFSHRVDDLGLGAKGTDNGVLLLIAIKKNVKFVWKSDGQEFL